MNVPEDDSVDDSNDFHSINCHSEEIQFHKFMKKQS